MELNDALRIPLAPSVVRASLEDIALLRASFDHCESFVQLAHGEYALTLTVPLGPLRARYDVRAHITSEQGDAEGQPRRILNFKARADGIGALRGQIEIVLYPDASADDATRIEYVVWATATGPLLNACRIAGPALVNAWMRSSHISPMSPNSFFHAARISEALPKNSDLIAFHVSCRNRNRLSNEVLPPFVNVVHCSYR